MSEVIDGVDSKFNGGLLQVARIHTLQERINNANLNVLAENSEVGIWNYELVLNCLNSLYQEVRPKCKVKEKVEVDLFREMIEYAILKYPPYEEKHKISGNSKKRISFNKSHWAVIRKYLIKYEELVRDLLDVHKLNSPPEDESAMF